MKSLKNVIESAKPQLILDEYRCKRNIERMVQKARNHEIEFRPHFKTHQSNHVARWFRDLNVRGITVSSVDMASYFASDGWEDITIAFPFYPLQIPALKRLENHASIRLFVNSPADLHLLETELKKPFKVILEIDPGFGRSGIHYQNHSLINQMIVACNRSSIASFHGFYTHDGRTYQSRSTEQIIHSSQQVIDILSDLKKTFPTASLMMGDTPSASVRDDFGPINELSPGNFVFYDWMQVQIGSCSIDDVAMFCLLPIAQIIPDSEKAIVLGGAVHLSKDTISVNGAQSYGQAVKYQDNKIQVIEHTFASALSQEHGTITSADLSVFDNQTILICPIHSCLTANLHDHYISTSGETIEKRILS